MKVTDKLLNLLQVFEDRELLCVNSEVREALTVAGTVPLLR